MAVKKVARTSAAGAASRSATKTAGTSSVARAKGSAGAMTRGGGVRKQLIVNPTYLQGAMAALGTTNMSMTVNVALERLAADAAILEGIDAAIGEIPDFPYLDS